MNYKVLVTLDLPQVTDKQREDFYESLRKNNWYKLPTLTTAWRVIFTEGATRESAIVAIKKHISDGKVQSKAPKVEYALQLDMHDIVITTI